MAKKAQKKGKRFILEATDKGGVGKTFVMTQLIQYLKEEYPGLNLKAYDPDEANKSLLAFQEDITSMVNVEDPLALDRMALNLQEYDVVLVDGLGSQQTNVFQHWIEDTSLLDVLEELGAKPTFLLVVTDDRENIKQARRILEMRGDRVEWLIVRNRLTPRQMERPDDRSSTDLWLGSETRKLALELGAKEILFPELVPTFAKLLNKDMIPVSVGASSEVYDVLARNRYKTTWRKIKAAFDNAKEVILP